MAEESGYVISSLRKPETVADLGRDCLSLHHVFGFDSSRRENWCLIETDKLIFATGSSVVLQDIALGTRDYLLTIDDQGIGCIAVHPSRKYFAVGGKGSEPNIYIYSYPDLKVCKVLREGAERGYACLDFSADGQKLASVSTNPDYMLTIWDWENETMGLHSKAFGQDVWNVKFSVDDSRRLTTSGIGHIRFWKMAATFTGLKLQGSIGKFGKVDLSDIEHFVELPDGKVLTGTDDGSLLLWEGNFIKCRFVQVGKGTCHNGPITYVQYDRKEKCIISASKDGSIKWWDFGAIDGAEVDSDHSMDFELLPLAEYTLPQGEGIKSLLDTGLSNNQRKFVFVTESGKGQILTFSWKEGGFLCDSLIKQKDEHENNQNFSITETAFDGFHAGKITGLDCSTGRPLVATCGLDGQVYCINYRKRTVVATRCFDKQACCLKWLPSSLDETGSSFAVGFEDGTVKILTLVEVSTSPGFELRLVMAFKPHNTKVVEIEFSPSGQLLATSSMEGTIFFFRCQSVMSGALMWDPLYFVDVAKLVNGTKTYCERMMWDQEEKYVLLTTAEGSLREIDISPILESSNSEDSHPTSFEIEVPFRELSASVTVKANSKAGTLEIVDPLGSSGTNGQSPPVEGNATASEGKDGNNDSTTTATAVVAKKKDDNANEEVATMTLKVTQAKYSLRKESRDGFVASVLLNPSVAFSCEIDTANNIVKQLPLGLYSLDGKTFGKFPSTASCRYSPSGKFLCEGMTDGSVVIRPANYLEIFCRYSGHNSAVNGVTNAAISYDDRYVFSVGCDGILAVFRIRKDLIESRAKDLHADIEAGVYAGELLKPEKKNKAEVKEPDYLFFVSSKKISQEEGTVVDSDYLSEDMIPAANDLPTTAYSIQDNRLRLEQDAKKSAAEELKSRVLASVRALRKDYEKVIGENEAIPESVRLRPEDLLVDRKYFDLAKDLFGKMISEIHLENAYQLEKSEAQLKKLKDYFMSGLLMEEIPLSSFQPPANSGVAISKRMVSTVWSLRITALSSVVKEVIAQVKSEVRQEELKESQMRSNELAQKKALSAMDEMKQRLQKRGEEEGGEKVDPLATIKDRLPGGPGSATLSAALGSGSGGEGGALESTAVVRRGRRKDRKEELKRHECEKPDEHEDDIRDIEAIKIAEKTIGDYKLKSAEDYEVPEDQRINAQKKIRQLAMLEDSMMMIRLAFNEKFLHLRQLKRDIIFSIAKDNDRIREIDRELSQSHLSQHLWQPSLDPEEFPDDRDEVTESELQQFIDQTKSVAWNKVPTESIPTHRLITGSKLSISRNQKANTYEVVRNDQEIVEQRDAEVLSKTFVKSDEDIDKRPPPSDTKLRYYELDESLVHSHFPNIEISPSNEASAVTSTGSATPSDTSSLEEKIPLLKFTKSLLKQRMAVTNPSRVQAKLNEQRKIKLQFERHMIQKNMTETLAAFSDAIDDLRVQRHKITSDLKLAEFKLLTLFQEFLLLQTFESRDNLLQQKQIKNKNDEKDNYSLMYENRMKLESKTEEIQHWNEKLAALTTELKTILPESHPYYDILSKIFRKRVKRNKNTGEDEDDDNANDDDSGSDDNNDDEDDDELEEVEDICPPGCDQLIFEKILDLREKKLDTEEVCAEINKNIEELKRTNERLKQREKQISKENQQTEYEVTQFQLQKQAALNQIKVVVPLRLSQLFTFENSGSLTGPSNDSQSDNKAPPPPGSSALEPVETSANQKSESLERRTLFSSLKLKSHTLFGIRNLNRLKDRIVELCTEIDESKESFRMLHKERLQLLRDRDSKAAETENWKQKCKDLQMLKFGREIDLDELEAFSDRSKEMEIEAILEAERLKFEKESEHLTKEVVNAKERLISVTKENTKLLEEVARLNEMKIKIASELNAPNKHIAPPSALDDAKEKEERNRIRAYVKFQATELESLRAELNMLKRKEAPIFSYTAPTMPNFQPLQDGSPK